VDRGRWIGVAALLVAGFGRSGGALPSWEERFRISGEAIPSWEVVFRISGEAIPSWEVVFRVSGEAIPASEVAFRISGEAIPSWELAFRVSGEAIPASEVAFRISGEAIPSWEVEFRGFLYTSATEEVGCLAHFDHSGLWREAALAESSGGCRRRSGFRAARTGFGAILVLYGDNRVLTTIPHMPDTVAPVVFLPIPNQGGHKAC
jgi:hypothetical protein